MAAFEQTGLWARAFGHTDKQPEHEARERLRVTYRQFWANAVVLAAQIQKSVPGLTLHDEAHFNALWARADQIAGQDYELTPLEVFVFGGAILLHDNANSIAAFPGGVEEIAAMPEWADALAEWRDRQPEGTSLDPLPEQGRDAVLFETLRSIHAQRAETLASLQVLVDGASYKLLPDDTLLKHLGGLICLIAASHHWDASALSIRLPERVGSLAGMPHSWTIRPVLLACLLRCADAVQLDQSRAPDFLFGLLQLKGLSAEHWRAQNRLATPALDPDDSRALLLTSTVSFAEDAADAWWIAYEAIHVANRELQAADAQLRDLRLPAFAISRIRGAESPLRLAEQVRVKGWQPVEAKVKISDIAKVVGTFGGEQLYGSDFTVPLRELIQNAADAVRLRRQLEPTGSGYNGRITVRLMEAKDDSVSLSVDDDGIGMSKAVLTGPLIDFGGSYLSSAYVKQERPGLKANARKRIGKYGIGFFSSFMLADEIRITSKPFDSGLDAVRTLLFRRGILDRPLLIDRSPNNIGSLVSTRIMLKVPQQNLEKMLRLREGIAKSKTTLTIEDLVGMLCPMLDVDVLVDSGSGPNLIHCAGWFNEDRRSWLNRILVPHASNNKFIKEQIEEAADRLRPIDPENFSAGIAAITSAGGAGVQTVGTLRAPLLFSQYADDFIGAIDHEPSGPRRDAGKRRAKSSIATWATEQAKLLAATHLTFPARQHAAERVAEFGGDASPLFGLQLNGTWVDLDAIAERLKAGDVLYAPIKAGDFHGGSPELTRVREHHSGFIDNYQPGELKYLVPSLEGTDSSKHVIYRYPEDKKPNKLGFFNIIGQRVAAEGYSLNAEGFNQIEFAEYVGEPSPREGLQPGKKIISLGLRLWATKM